MWASVAYLRLFFFSRRKQHDTNLGGNRTAERSFGQLTSERLIMHDTADNMTELHDVHGSSTLVQLQGRHQRHLTGGCGIMPFIINAAATTRLRDHVFMVTLPNVSKL